jgi:hypothetical protein
MKRLFFLFAFVFLMFSTVEVQAASCDDDVGVTTIESISVTIDLVATQATLFSQAKEILATSKKVEVLGSEDNYFGTVFIATYKSTKHEDDRNSYFKSYLTDSMGKVTTINLSKLQDQNNTYYMSYLRNC